MVLVGDQEEPSEELKGHSEPPLHPRQLMSSDHSATKPKVNAGGLEEDVGNQAHSKEKNKAGSLAIALLNQVLRWQNRDFNGHNI